ncbi:hypothetical protein C8R44DRAFT_735871 [Mycena epipterygia]|nr:hypothetical protein C8R44DRAFT_735871 [Mycena epipterygia]
MDPEAIVALVFPTPERPVDGELSTIYDFSDHGSGKPGAKRNTAVMIRVWIGCKRRVPCPGRASPFLIPCIRNGKGNGGDSVSPIYRSLGIDTVKQRSAGRRRMRLQIRLPQAHGPDLVHGSNLGGESTTDVGIRIGFMPWEQKIQLEETDEMRKRRDLCTTLSTGEGGGEGGAGFDPTTPNDSRQITKAPAAQAAQATSDVYIYLETSMPGKPGSCVPRVPHVIPHTVG